MESSNLYEPPAETWPGSAARTRSLPSTSFRR